MRRDDLHTPLGVQKGAPPRIRLGAYALAVFTLALAAIGVLAYLRAAAPAIDRSIATATITTAPSPPNATTSSLAQAAPQRVAESPTSPIALESGVKVVRGGASAHFQGEIIHVPDALAKLDDQNDSVTQAVDPNLIASGPFGPLPKIDSDGSTPFDTYRRHQKIPESKPKIAIIITGLGLNPAITTASSEELPPEVTFAFSSIGGELWKQTAEAKRAGHELMLQIPMEPLVSNGGPSWPHELKTNASALTNVDAFKWDMARFTGYFGVINFLGSSFTANASALKPIMQQIAARGLGYVDDGTSATSQAQRIASGMNIPVARADVFFNEQKEGDDLDRDFARLLEIAKSNGSALGIAPALPELIEALKRRISGPQIDGFALVPASSIMVEAPDLARSSN